MENFSNAVESPPTERKYHCVDDDEEDTSRFQKVAAETTKDRGTEEKIKYQCSTTIRKKKPFQDRKKVFLWLVSIKKVMEDTAKIAD